MKILFISSGNSKNGISPIIKNQGESLKQFGIEIEFYPIQGKGLNGYIKNIKALRNHFFDGDYDLAHAHYSLIGIIASLARIRPLVVSLMGSDIYEFKWLKLITKIFSLFLWSETIVKSNDMKDYLKLKNLVVVPNGVDFNKFRIYSSKEIREKLPKYDKPIILFLGNPSKPEKNINLAKEAVQELDIDHIFLPVFNTDNSLIPYYMNIASVLILTSLWEGSPNVIKEAMACNLPIVTVKVGDVKEVIGSTEGCYITSYNSKELSEALEKAIKFRNRTDGRSQINHLSDEFIAKRLISIYQKHVSI